LFVRRRGRGFAQGPPRDPGAAGRRPPPRRRRAKRPALRPGAALRGPAGGV